MSHITLRGLVVVVVGALSVAACANDSTGPDEPASAADSTANQTPTPDRTPAPPTASRTPATSSSKDLCPFIPGEEGIIRCLCGVCALATTCDSVCGNHAGPGAKGIDGAQFESAHVAH